MKTDEFVLPSHCHHCGAYLMGGATKHDPECPIQKIIDGYNYLVDTAECPPDGIDEVLERLAEDIRNNPV